MTAAADTLVEYRTATAAAKAWARSHGWEGRPGGWIYNPAGKPWCHGWQSLVSYLARQGVIVDLNGEKLATRSDVEKQRGNRWAGLRRNVFDGKPVALVV